MADKVSESPVRIIGSRELHQNLPGILRELESDRVRYVLTVHGKPRAVLIGAEPYLNMILDGKRSSEAVVGLQLTALLGGNLESHSLDDLERALDQRTERTETVHSSGR
jgi:prevent-host-death family protein